MTTKTITIMEDVYRLLRIAKRRRKSFSKMLRGKFSEKQDIMELAGAWAHLSDKEIEDRKSKIRKMRERSTQELFAKIKRWREKSRHGR